MGVDQHQGDQPARGQVYRVAFNSVEVRQRWLYEFPWWIFNCVSGMDEG